MKDIFIVITTMYKKCLGNVGGKLGYTIAKTKALIGKVLILKDKRSFIVNDFSNKIKSKILHICFLLFCFCFFCFYENKSLMMLTNNSCHFCSLYWPKTFKSISDLREIKKKTLCINCSRFILCGLNTWHFFYFVMSSDQSCNHLFGTNTKLFWPLMIQV